MIGMKLPAEDILQYIERNRGIVIVRNRYASSEYYNPHHPVGKNTPAYWANNGKGDGKHVTLVEIDKEIFVVDSTGKAVAEPVHILVSGRDNER